MTTCLKSENCLIDRILPHFQTGMTVWSLIRSQSSAQLYLIHHLSPVHDDQETCMTHKNFVRYLIVLESALLVYAVTNFSMSWTRGMVIHRWYQGSVVTVAAPWNYRASPPPPFNTTEISCLVTQRESCCLIVNVNGKSFTSDSNCDPKCTMSVTENPQSPTETIYFNFYSFSAVMEFF